MSARVLVVDDEPRILDAFRRNLRTRYDIGTAASGTQGLDLLQSAQDDGDPFHVVISDMKMPGMNGAEFLALARGVAPDTVQMILSGQADLVSTIAAVNNGNLFRFLSKPCGGDDLSRAIDDALRQYQLVVAERELLERTLHGAVEVLTEVLSMASPQAFSRTGVIRNLTEKVAERLGVSMGWQLGLATMLSQLGCIAIPAPVLQRAQRGRFLNGEEEEMFAAHPGVARQLLLRIPRLEPVAALIGDQPTSPENTPDTPVEGAEAIFAATTEFVLHNERGASPRQAVRTLRASERYPAELLDCLLEVAIELATEGAVHQITIEEVVPGMVIDRDVRTSTGMVLVRRGERVTPILAVRLANFAKSVGVEEPIHVIGMPAAEPPGGSGLSGPGPA